MDAHSNWFQLGSNHAIVCLGRSFDASHLHDRFRSKSHFQTATRQRVLAFRGPCSWLRPPSGCVPLPSLWWRCRARCGNRSEHDGTRVWICEVWADSQDQHARIWATRKPTIRGVLTFTCRAGCGKGAAQWMQMKESEEAQTSKWQSAAWWYYIVMILPMATEAIKFQTHSSSANTAKVGRPKNDFTGSDF